MMDVESEKLIKQLHVMGKSIREISKTLNIARNSVRRVIRPIVVDKSRKDKTKIDIEVLKSVYKKCCGWGQRMNEVLRDEHDIQISYSTLMRLVHEHNLSGKKEKKRSGHEPTIAGVEMQHDTSPHKVKIGGVVTNVTSSVLYYRYSKQRYLKLYPHFKRFDMKCFFYEALKHYKYAAPICVIDNTNLAVLRGTGTEAIFITEMVNFARDFGFKWFAHEKGHANRKAGEERSFWTVETNFFPGREFATWEDLNEQALKWSTVILPDRPQTKDKIIPKIWFEQEKELLTPVTDFVREPNLLHDRTVDQYGGVAFDANQYWVPESASGIVQVIEYRDRILIFKGREFLIEYKLPAFETKAERYGFENKKIDKKIKEARLKKTTQDEEFLRKEAPELNEYLDFVLKKYPVWNARNQFLRELLSLFRKVSRSIFLEIIVRANKYKITDVKVVERMCIQFLRNSLLEIPLPEVVSEFEDSAIYQEGRRSATPDLNYYQSMLEANQESEESDG
jgi:transposase